MEQKTSDIVLGMLIKQLNKDPKTVKPEMRIKEDLGADSLDLVELLMSIEEKYGVSVPDEQAMGVKTVADLIALVDSLAK